MNNMLQVGGIASTHGIRGEVKVFPMTDDVTRFKKLKKCVIDTGKEQISVEIESCKFFKQFVILKFKGIDNINDVEQFKQCGLWIDKAAAVKLKKDEYFIGDMIGCNVINEENNAIGILTEVLTSKANDVYVVKTPDNKEILIPAIKQCILAVDLEQRFIKVHLLEGLVT